MSEPSREPGGERFACVIRGEQGTTHIGLLTPGNPGVAQITVGDAMDSAPRWVPRGGRLVFESRALGYNRAGQVVEVAPSTIQELDLERGEVTPLAAAEGMSCTSPRVTLDGTLYYLRRPVPKPKIHPGNVLVAALLTPFRLIMAVIQWFNFFSLRYTGKPLLPRATARAKQADIKRAAMLGNFAMAAEDAHDEEDEEESKVPKDWQLVRRRGDENTVIAGGVACFDLYDDGSIIWSDGRSVYYVTTAGEEQKVGKRKDVSELLALDPRQG